MHHCLSIPDILLLICNEIKSPSTLAAMARSCRAFQGPALIFLWRRQSSLLPILGCLLDRRLIGPAKTLGRKLEPADCNWDRFSSYAKLIREFHLIERGGFGIVPEIEADAIYALAQGRWTFPNLLRVQLQTWDAKCGTEFDLVLEPSVTNLQFDLERQSSLAPSKLHSMCSAVKDLTIDSGNAEQSAHICLWNDLQCFTHTTFSNNKRQTLAHLSAMHNLVELEISYRLPVVSDSTHLMLRTLRILTFACHVCPSNNYIRNLRVPYLSVLRIGYHDNAGGLIGHLFQFLSEWLGDSPLSELNIRIIGSKGAAIVANDFRPLYNLVNVKHCRIFVPTIAADDHLVREVATAWPHLRTLELGSTFALHGRWMTLEGLVFLLQKCRSLSDLYVEWDARTVGERPLEDVLSGAAPNTDIQSMGVGPSPIDNATQVATALSRVAPNLRIRVPILYIKTAHRNWTYDWQWDYVNTLLQRRLTYRLDGDFGSTVRRTNHVWRATASEFPSFARLFYFRKTQ